MTSFASVILPCWSVVIMRTSSTMILSDALSDWLTTNSKQKQIETIILHIKD